MNKADVPDKRRVSVAKILMADFIRDCADDEAEEGGRQYSNAPG